MKKKYWLMTLGVVLLASCQKSPSPTQSADPDTAAAPTAPAKPMGAEAAKANGIKPGMYRVCQDAGESGHGNVMGPHLVVGQKVQITAVGTHATKVCFKKECPPEGSNLPESEVKVMWLAGDEKRLGGESSFDHQTEDGQVEKVSHFVEIFNSPDDQGDAALCKKANVLTINFCTVDEGELNCVGGTGPHLGHVHGEN